MDLITRNPDNDEIPMLRDILCETFGSEGHNAFFSMLYSPERTIVVCADGIIAAMGYLIPMGEFMTKTPGSFVTCAMIYAVATLPEYRSRGLGAYVTNSLINTAYDTGFDCVVLCPRDESLFEFYKKHTDMQDWFYFQETIADRAVVPGLPHFKNKITPVRAPEYCDIRESLLKDTPHIKQNAECVEFQKALCDEMGGGLYRIGDSCAVVEVQSGGEVWVKELLIAADDDLQQVIQGIQYGYPSDKYIIRTPVKNGKGSRRFGMLTAKNAAAIAGTDSSTAPWYGLAFD